MRYGHRWAWAVLLSLGLMAGAASAEKQWLSYRVFNDNHLDEQYVTCPALKDVPADAQKPEFKAKDPWFASWPMALAPQGKVLLAFDRSSKNGQYDQVYVDATGKGAWKDVKPVRAKNSHEYGAEFGPVKVTVPGEDGPITYHVRFYLQAQEKSRRLYVITACAYQGDVRIGDKSYRLSLLDYNCNGTFDDLSADFSKSDRLRLGEEGKTKLYSVGKYLMVDGKLYRTKPARDGSSIEFEAAPDVALGSVRATNPVTELCLAGENGLFRLENGAGSVPAGKYKLHSWKIERKASDNAKWTMEASASRGSVEVKAGQELAMDVGEPVVCKAAVSSGREGMQFSQSLCGRMNERVSIELNGGQAEAPKLEIKNKDGTFAKVYKFEYG